jgi:hypothetical protein
MTGLKTMQRELDLLVAKRTNAYDAVMAAEDNLVKAYRAQLHSRRLE